MVLTKVEREMSYSPFHEENSRELPEAHQLRYTFGEFVEIVSTPDEGRQHAGSIASATTSVPVHGGAAATNAATK